MNRLTCLLLLSMSAVAFAGDPPTPAAPAPTCFELSADGKAWSRTPELMCIGAGDKNVQIELKTGIPPAQVAVFHFDLTKRVRCADCNKDVFSLANATNSVLNTLQISFDGKRDIKAGTEAGTVSIGKTQLYYRRVK